MTAMTKVEVLRAACCIAGADKEVDPQELAVLTKLAERVGVGKASLDAMVLRSETESDFYKQQFRVLKDDPEETVKLLFGVAGVDGELESNEIEMLKVFGRRLGIDNDTFVAIGRATKKALQKGGDRG